MTHVYLYSIVMHIWLHPCCCYVLGFTSQNACVSVQPCLVLPFACHVVLVFQCLGCHSKGCGSMRSLHLLCKEWRVPPTHTPRVPHTHSNHDAAPFCFDFLAFVSSPFVCCVNGCIFRVQHRYPGRGCRVKHPEVKSGVSQGLRKTSCAQCIVSQGSLIISPLQSGGMYFVSPPKEAVVCTLPALTRVMSVL